MNWLQKTSSGPYTRTLYHGTNKSFNSFDISFSGIRDYGDFGIGIYLTPSSTLAIMYADDAVNNNGGEPIIHVVKSNLQNVATTEELMEVIHSIEIPENKDLSDNKQSRSELDSKSITKRMLDLGFDGAIARGDRGEVVIYNSSALEIIRSLSPEEASFLP